MGSKLQISAVVFTKDEEKNIKDCLQSLSRFSEVVVIDSKSSDSTCELAAAQGARVVHFNWDGKYPKKRQWSLENVAYLNEWILFIDADERVTEPFVIELQKFIQFSSGDFGGASIPIEYYFGGKRLKFGHKPRKTVLLRLGRASYPVVKDLAAEGMGELEGHYQPIIDGKVSRFKSGILHNDNDLISSWMTRHVKYAGWEAHLLINSDAKNVVDISKGRIASKLHKLPFRPLGFFIYSYIFKFGFLDGRVGFDYAFAKCWYYWLSSLIAREKMLHGK
jgi:glycosyltransferase involved in cell wall biosynthesis